MLTSRDPVFTRPKYSSIRFGRLPAVFMSAGLSIFLIMCASFSAAVLGFLLFYSTALTSADRKSKAALLWVCWM
jgi:hypothetical protein